MPYALIKDGMVVQKSCSEEDGFIEVDESVTCGYLYDEKTKNFVHPPIPISDNTEEKIQQEIRRIAIESLKKRGELSADYADKTEEEAV